MKQVSGFPGYYVCEDGRVLSDKRHKLIQLRPDTDRFGYRRVVLYSCGKRKRIGVHVLVARAFCSNEDGKPQVNHKDMDKSNNHASNLEWVTAKENVMHGLEMSGKRMIPAMIDGMKMTSFSSGYHASDMTGLNPGHIWEACNGKRPTAGGKRWVRVNP